MSAEFDRKIAEMSFQFNHRVATMSTEFEKLAALMQQSHAAANVAVAIPHMTHKVASPAAAPLAPQAQSQPPPPQSSMLQSLSQVAGMRLAHPSPAGLGPQPSPAQAVPVLGEKRPAEEEQGAPQSRLRVV